MKRFTLVLFSLVIIFSGFSAAQSQSLDAAYSSSYETRYSYITEIYTSLSIQNGVAQCRGSIEINSLDMTVAITVRLQRSLNGTSWTTIGTWTANGQYYAMASAQQSISSGYYYRTYVYGRVLDENGTCVESATKYSSIVSY